MPSVMGKQWVSNATWQKRMKNEAKNKKGEKIYCCFKYKL